MFDGDPVIRKLNAEIERLRARADRAHDALNSMFWEGGIDQEDAAKVQGILRGDDEQKANP